MGQRVFRSRQVTLSAAFASAAVTVALATSGCQTSAPPPAPPYTPPDDYAQVCVDQSTNLRTDDDRCDGDGHSGFAYFYYPSHHRAPAVGHPATGASAIRPADAPIVRAPAAGRAAVPRGGFGGHAGTGTGG